MAHRTLKSADQEGMLRAFWEELKEQSAAGHADITIVVTPTTRRGVFRWRLEYWPRVGGSRDFPQTAVSMEYPSAQNTSLEAALYALSSKLAFTVEEQVKGPEHMW